MDETIYREWIDSISAYYAKGWKDETKTAWYPKLKHVKRQALKWLYTKITELDVLPINFPMVVLRYYNLWLSDHPEHKKEYEAGCENCHAGWITVAYIGYADQVYTTAFKCAACNARAMPKEAPAWHLEQVIASGKYYRPVGRSTHGYFHRLPPLPGYD